MKLHTASRALALAVSMLTASVSAPGVMAGEALKIDHSHSTIGFSVRHLFSRVNGQFREFEGTIEFDEKAIEASKVTASIKAASVDTNVQGRDEDLRSKRFFDAASFPTLEFVSTGVKKVDGASFEISGKLTMHGVTKDVVLSAEFLGKGKDPWGNLKYGFHAETIVNRKDFGMQWNEVVETGGVLVGEEITITLDIEAAPAS
jgi:polyisoprenoid-binding protein YceI